MPAPFNFLWAILTNQKMLTFTEKLQTAPPLVPMLLGGQERVPVCLPARCLSFSPSLPSHPSFLQLH